MPPTQKAPNGFPVSSLFCSDCRDFYSDDPRLLTAPVVLKCGKVQCKECALKDQRRFEDLRQRVLNPDSSKKWQSSSILPCFGKKYAKVGIAQVMECEPQNMAFFTKCTNQEGHLDCLKNQQPAYFLLDVLKVIIQEAGEIPIFVAHPKEFFGKIRRSMECGICMENYTDHSQTPLVLECGHGMCLGCYSKNKKENNCPRCRQIFAVSKEANPWSIQPSCNPFTKMVDEIKALESQATRRSSLRCVSCKDMHLFDRLFLCLDCGRDEIRTERSYLCGHCFATDHNGHRNEKAYIYEIQRTAKDFQNEVVKKLALATKSLPLQQKELEKQLVKLQESFANIFLQIESTSNVDDAEEIGAKLSSFLSSHAHDSKNYIQTLRNFHQMLMDLDKSVKWLNLNTQTASLMSIQKACFLEGLKLAQNISDDNTTSFIHSLHAQTLRLQDLLKETFNQFHLVIERAHSSDQAAILVKRCLKLLQEYDHLCQEHLPKIDAFQHLIEQRIKSLEKSEEKGEIQKEQGLEEDQKEISNSLVEKTVI